MLTQGSIYFSKQKYLRFLQFTKTEMVELAEIIISVVNIKDPPGAIIPNQNSYSQHFEF